MEKGNRGLIRICKKCGRECYSIKRICRECYSSLKKGTKLGKLIRRQR